VLVFIRREISRHIGGAEGAELLRGQGPRLLRGAVVWKGRRIAATDLLLSTYGVVASRRVVSDAELNSPSEPEYILLDKYICNKEETRIEAPKYRRSEIRVFPI